MDDLKNSKCAKLNKHLFDPSSAGKKRKKKQECDPVIWMRSQLAAWSLENNIAAVSEHHFIESLDNPRQWRFDFAIPSLKLAYEYEGIFSPKSRHTTLTGYQGDIEKYNAAAERGWQVIRYTNKNYKDFSQDLKKIKL